MSRKVRLIALSVWLALFALIQPAAADNGRPGFVRLVAISVLAHDVSNLWSGFKREDGVDINAEIVFNYPSFDIFGGTIRPHAGIDVNTQGDTSKLYAGGVWEIETELGFFFNIGLGAALHNGKLKTRRRDKKELGSPVLFHIPIEIGYQLGHHRLSVYFSHVSNAFLADRNEGLDVLGVRYGFKF